MVASDTVKQKMSYYVNSLNTQDDSKKTNITCYTNVCNVLADVTFPVLYTLTLN